MNNEINKRLMKIFNQRFEITVDETDEVFFTENLLGDKIRFQPRDLIYLFFDIEKEFNIIIPQEEVAKGNFNTVNNIAKIIEGALAAA